MCLRKIMRFSFLNLYQREEHVMYAMCVYRYASFYILLPSTRREKYEHRTQTFKTPVFSRTFEGPEPFFIFSCGRKTIFKLKVLLEFVRFGNVTHLNEYCVVTGTMFWPQNCYLIQEFTIYFIVSLCLCIIFRNLL